jgi:hypothetical protein
LHRRPDLAVHVKQEGEADQDRHHHHQALRQDDEEDAEVGIQELCHRLTPPPSAGCARPPGGSVRPEPGSPGRPG